MQIKRYAKWTVEQSDAAFRMADQGLNNAQIARKLGRTQNAVCSRLQMRKRVFDSAVELPPKPIPKAIITKDEVPEFYSLGWRLASFVYGAIVFEWPRQDTPIYPQSDTARAA